MTDAGGLSAAAPPITVLVVDDDALTRELHGYFVARVPGFRVVAEAASARQALAVLLDPSRASDPNRRIDLVLLDVTMPDGTGLDVLRRARAEASGVDVIAVTGVRDVDIVRQVVALGVAHYLVKPFAFATFREQLEAYRAYRERAVEVTGAATQAEIDDLVGALRPATGTIAVPKGLSGETLARVLGAARERGAISAREAGDALGLSRVSARRYLEHLADAGLLTHEARYGTGGRPESEYRAR